jgi:peptidoglycan/xylan/chitin deacetylase (PgdA/CDA1 family)
VRRARLALAVAVALAMLGSGPAALAADLPDPSYLRLLKGTLFDRPVDPFEPLPGTVAFTFDDGPHPRWTPYILDVLDRLDVKATFFVNGFRVERYPEIARDIVERGHSLQNHGYGHGNLTLWSDAAVARDVTRGTRAILEATGHVPTCMRPPFGATSKRTTAIIEGLGLRVLIWDENSRDYAHQSSEVLRAISHQWEDGEDVLMHDSNGYLYDDGVLEDLIAEVRSRGLGFSTLCENVRPPATTPSGIR